MVLVRRHGGSRTGQGDWQRRRNRRNLSNRVEISRRYGVRLNSRIPLVTSSVWLSTVSNCLPPLASNQKHRIVTDRLNVRTGRLDKGWARSSQGIDRQPMPIDSSSSSSHPPGSFRTKRLYNSEDRTNENECFPGLDEWMSVYVGTLIHSRTFLQEIPLSTEL